MMETSEELMPCMEVRGGNHSVDEKVMLAGITVRVYSRPYAGEDQGGDVHYVSSCATGRITRLLVADVSGHGQAVAKISRELRSLMRRFVNFLDQGRFVAELNRRFVDLGSSGAYATAVVATYFGPTGNLSISNAGHPPPAIFRAEDKTWSYLEAPPDSPSAMAEAALDTTTNIPLGVLSITEYTQFETELREGDLVIFYSDAIPEAPDLAGHRLGMDGFLEILRDLDMATDVDFLANLVDDVRAGGMRKLTGDDLTIMVFEPNSETTWTDLRRKLGAPFKVMAGLLRSLLPGGGPGPWPELSIANLGGAMFGGLNRLWRGRKAASSSADSSVEPANHPPS